MGANTRARGGRRVTRAEEKEQADVDGGQEAQRSRGCHPNPPSPHFAMSPPLSCPMPALPWCACARPLQSGPARHRSACVARRSHRGAHGNRRSRRIGRPRSARASQVPAARLPRPRPVAEGRKRGGGKNVGGTVGERGHAVVVRVVPEPFMARFRKKKCTAGKRRAARGEREMASMLAVGYHDPPSLPPQILALSNTNGANRNPSGDALVVHLLAPPIPKVLFDSRRERVPRTPTPVSAPHPPPLQRGVMWPISPTSGRDVCLSLSRTRVT